MGVTERGSGPWQGPEYIYIYHQKQNEFVCIVGALEVSPFLRS